MSNLRLSLRNSGTSLVLLTAALVFASPTAAQCQQMHEFQIMVNGPWDYVLDPEPERDGGSPGEDRIVLVAPAMMDANKDMIHVAHIFWGTDATKPPDDAPPVNPSTPGNLALYYLDFVRELTNIEGNSDTEEPPKLYHPRQAVSIARIKHILYGSSAMRYAISLPMPDYVSTYTGEYGSGFAESKINTGSVTNGMVPQNYTIWMVFHYTVATTPPAVSVRMDDGSGSSLQKRSDIPTPNPAASNSYGISITLMESTTRDNDRCDTVSGKSFSDSMQMWHLPEHARFPVARDVDGDGQYPGYYDYEKCFESHGLNVDQMSRRIKEIRKNNDKMFEAIKKLRSELVQAEKTVAVADFKEVEDLLLASPGPGQSARVRHDLTCVKALINHEERQQGCPAKFTPEVVNQYFGTGDRDGRMGLLTVGRSDCHKAQISINGVLP